MSTPPAPLVSLGRLLVFSPLGLSFTDDFTGGAPVGFISPALWVETPPGSGKWLATGVRGLFTPGGLLAYPNLGRRGRVPPPPVASRNYRVTLDTQYYSPLYPVPTGVVFPVTPFDDDTDFSALKPTMIVLPLLPNANYPFDGTTAFLNGTVVTTAGAPAVALLTAVEPIDDTGDIKRTRVMTDPGGRFRLPLRWGNAHSPTTVTALDPASMKSTAISLTYPYVLSGSRTIAIPNP